MLLRLHIQVQCKGSAWLKRLQRAQQAIPHPRKRSWIEPANVAHKDFHLRTPLRLKQRLQFALVRLPSAGDTESVNALCRRQIQQHIVVGTIEISGPKVNCSVSTTRAHLRRHGNKLQKFCVKWYSRVCKGLEYLAI